MKFLNILTTAAVALVAFAQETSPINNLDIKISFPESFSSPDGIVSLTNEEETPVQFRITNGESEPLVLAAFGGAIYDKKAPETPYTNLTTTSLSPVEILPGQAADVSQAIRVALPPKEFDLAFTLYFSFNEEILTVTLSKTPVSVNDPPVSSLDPKLLFVQIILGVTAIVIGYFVSTKVILPNLEKKYPKKPVPKEKSTTRGVNPGAKGYDESWIPQEHLKKNKKKA